MTILLTDNTHQIMIHKIKKGKYVTAAGSTDRIIKLTHKYFNSIEKAMEYFYELREGSW